MEICLQSCSIIDTSGEVKHMVVWAKGLGWGQLPFRKGLLKTATLTILVNISEWSSFTQSPHNTLERNYATGTVAMYEKYDSVLIFPWYSDHCEVKSKPLMKSNQAPKKLSLEHLSEPIGTHRALVFRSKKKHLKVNTVRQSNLLKYIVHNCLL